MVCYLIFWFLINFAITVQNNYAITNDDIFNVDSEEEETFLTDDDFREDLTVQDEDVESPVQDEDVESPVQDEDVESLGIENSHLYNPNLFEGDIKGFHVGNMMDQVADGTEGTHRLAILDESKKWPAGQVPYAISRQYNSQEQRIIEQAFEEFHKKTCIRFIPKTANHQDYIYIEKREQEGCSSWIGKIGDRQILSLADGCIKVGTIIHELLHAVGIFHEQSRMDRNEYVDIFEENIEPGKKSQFQQYPGNKLNLPYDIRSIMHYDEYAFTKYPGVATLRAKNGQKLGQRDGFTTLDLQKINKFYKCEKPKPKPEPHVTPRPIERHTRRPTRPRERRTQRPVIPDADSDELVDQSGEHNRNCPQNLVQKNLGKTHINNGVIGKNIGKLIGNRNTICFNIGKVCGSNNIICHNTGRLSGNMNVICNHHHHHQSGKKIKCMVCSMCANIENC